MAGLKICTRWRANSARRSRRISSSLLPENIGPTTTSIQPILPLTISTLAPLIRSGGLLGDRTAVIHRLIKKRRKCRNHRNPKRFLPGNFVRAQHAPRAPLVANSGLAGKPVNRYGKFDALHEDFFGQRLGQFHSARPAEMSARPV